MQLLQIQGCKLYLRHTISGILSLSELRLACLAYLSHGCMLTNQDPKLAMSEWSRLAPLSRFESNMTIVSAARIHRHACFAAGQQEYWDVFQDAYRAVMRHYRSGAWYDDSDIVSGRSVHQQFQSLQAFWPGPPEPHAMLCCAEICHAVLCSAALGCTGNLCAVMCCDVM